MLWLLRSTEPLPTAAGRRAASRWGETCPQKPEARAPNRAEDTLTLTPLPWEGCPVLESAQDAVCQIQDPILPGYTSHSFISSGFFICKINTSQCCSVEQMRKQAHTKSFCRSQNPLSSHSPLLFLPHMTTNPKTQLPDSSCKTGSVLATPGHTGPGDYPVGHSPKGSAEPGFSGPAEVTSMMAVASGS